MQTIQYLQKKVLPMKTWKNHPQKRLIIGTNSFFQYCQLAQNQPKSQFLFNKNCSPHDVCIMTLSARLIKSDKQPMLHVEEENDATVHHHMN